MASTDFVLYHNKWSAFAIMARYTIAIRGEPNENLDLRFTEHEVDIYAGDQLAEDYLLNIDRQGRVPVLNSSLLGRPITDCLFITRYLGDLFPSLMPAPHKAQILRLLTELHGIDFCSLTQTGRASQKERLIAHIQRRLQGNPPDEYRLALLHKLELTEKARQDAQSPEHISLMWACTRRLMAALANLLEFSGREAPNVWLFGLARPSALDAHLVVFLTRMRDIGRDQDPDLIPPKLRAYAEVARETPEWQDVMQGRATMESRN